MFCHVMLARPISGSSPLFKSLRVCVLAALGTGLTLSYVYKWYNKVQLVLLANCVCVCNPNRKRQRSGGEEQNGQLVPQAKRLSRGHPLSPELGRDAFDPEVQG